MERLEVRPAKGLRYVGLAVGGLFMTMGTVVMAGQFVPGETFTPGLCIVGAVFFLGGLAYWQFFASSRVIVDQGVLSRRMFGRTLWTIPLDRASLRVGMDPSDRGAYMLNVIAVHYRQGQGLVGVIPYKQMHPDDVARLFQALNLPTKAD